MSAFSSRSTHSTVLLLILGAAAAFAACGTSEDSTFKGGPGSGADSGTGPGGDFGDGGSIGPGSVVVSSLAFDPPTQTLTVDGVTPQTASYTLRATLPDGKTVTVAPESLQFDRPDLASATSGDPVTLTTPGAFGGTGKLHGIYGGVEAVAELKVNVVRKDIGAGVSQNAVAALDGANLATDPSLTTLRYPYDKTVFPLGLTSPLVMWDAPASGDVYKLRLEEANYTYETYAVVNGLGRITADQTMWDRVTASNSGDPLKVTLSRYSNANQTAYASASETWTIAHANLRGAIYYWTASDFNGDRKGHIARIRPGSGAQPEPLDTHIPGNTCMGCHAVSADGSTLAASLDGAPTGNPASYAYTNGWSTGRGWASFDLPSGDVRKQTAMAGNNLALTPDGKYTVFGGRFQTNAQASSNTWVAGSKYLTLADTKTGTPIVDSGLDDLQLAGATMGLAMPAFSPDGKWLATVEFTGNSADLRDNVLPNSTGILLFGFDQPTTKFSPTPTRLPLGAAGTFNPYSMSGIGYPSFTPSTKFVAYHVGNHSTGCFDERSFYNDGNKGNCDDFTRHKGAIFYQATDGVGTPVRLTALDDPPAAGDHELSVEPTFNPIERGNYSWVVFTSMRDWGNKLTGAAVNGKRRLWIAAIDVATGAADPSHPPFYLEGQEDSPNMRGFWTLAACTPTPPPGGTGGQCTAGFECCSGFCNNGVCVDVSTIACVGVGGDCTQSSECCNPQSVSCVDGRCKAKLVK